MDFLGQSVNQIRDLFRTMTPAARITSGLLLGVIVVSLGYLVQSQTSGPGGYLFNGESLQPREADRVLAAVDQGGLTGAVRDGNRIQVPHGRELEFMGAIADAGALPADFDTLLLDSLNSSLFASSAVQKEQVKSLRERRIAMLLREMAGVADAKVIYASSEERGRGFANERSTATVSVLPESSAEFTAKQIKMVQKAVAMANGMSPADVVVLDQRDSTELAARGGAADADFDDPYYSTRIKYENYLESEIRNLLDYIPRVRVEVSATLEKQLSSETHTTAAQGEGSPLRESSQLETTKNTRTENSGRPGLTANGPTRNATNENVAQTQSETSLETTDIESLVPRSDTIITESGLVPERVMAAVIVPRDYVVDVWKQRQKMTDPNADPTALPNTQDISLLETNIRNDIGEAVIRLFPRKSTEDQFKDIAITFVDSLTPEAIDPPTTTSQALQWASQNFSTMIMAGVAVMSLTMLRSLVKSIPPTDPIASLAGPTLGISGFDDDDESTAPTSMTATGTDGQSQPVGERTKLKLNKGPSLKDDLTDIVREDPDAAAAILRSWIGSAA